MNELYLELAGLRLFARAEAVCRLDFLEGYIAAPSEPDHRFLAVPVERMEPPVGELVLDQPAIRCYRDGKRLLTYQGVLNADSTSAYMRTIRQEEQTIVEYVREKMPTGISGKKLLQGMEIPHLLTIHDGFLLHAAFIEHAGGAILFTAPSETGKSTQAKLWCDHAGAELINGDRAAVRIMDGSVFACGTPFSGSSDVRKNRTLPLKAIVYLTQAPENAVQRLRGVKAFRRVWEGCTVNIWDRGDVEKATKTVSGVIGCIPVYHLACTPDLRAVEALRHTMEVET